MYAGFSVMGMIIIFFILPETKDRNIDECEELFMSDKYRKTMKMERP